MSEAKQEEASEEKDIAAYVADLSSSNRRTRQKAGSALAELARTSPEALQPEIEQVTNALLDSLFRPEDQTRWEALDALCEIALTNPELVTSGFDGAEAALFDENSDHLHTAAFRFLCRLGATSAKQAEKVWPDLDEAIQCYHGDHGYRGMLDALLEFAEGKASKKVKAALAERLSFDATNKTSSVAGYVNAASEKIVAACNA